MRREFDLAVYLVTNSGVAREAGYTVEDVVARALDGGATMIQLREKDLPKDELVELGRRLLQLTRRAGVPLIVNDSVEVALAIGADGAHIGQRDIAALQARWLLGESRILGVSVTSVQEARRAEAARADYIGIGPIFPTRTKCDADIPIGLDALAQVAHAVTIPTVAIGGIVHENAAQVVHCGVHGVAVISAIAAQTNPRDASCRLLEIVWASRNGR